MLKLEMTLDELREIMTFNCYFPLSELSSFFRWLPGMNWEEESCGYLAAYIKSGIVLFEVAGGRFGEGEPRIHLLKKGKLITQELCDYLEDRLHKYVHSMDEIDHLLLGNPPTTQKAQGHIEELCEVANKPGELPILFGASKCHEAYEYTDIPFAGFNGFGVHLVRLHDETVMMPYDQIHGDCGAIYSKRDIRFLTKDDFRYLREAKSFLEERVAAISFILGTQKFRTLFR